MEEGGGRVTGVLKSVRYPRVNLKGSSSGRVWRGGGGHVKSPCGQDRFSPDGKEGRVRGEGDVRRRDRSEIQRKYLPSWDRRRWATSWGWASA